MGISWKQVWQIRWNIFFYIIIKIWKFCFLLLTFFLTKICRKNFNDHLTQYLITKSFLKTWNFYWFDSFSGELLKYFLKSFLNFTEKFVNSLTFIPFLTNLANYFFTMYKQLVCKKDFLLKIQTSLLCLSNFEIFFYTDIKICFLLHFLNWQQVLNGNLYRNNFENQFGQYFVPIHVFDLEIFLQKLMTLNFLYTHRVNFQDNYWIICWNSSWKIFIKYQLIGKISFSEKYSYFSQNFFSSSEKNIPLEPNNFAILLLT